jgi:arsenate reductase
MAEGFLKSLDKRYEVFSAGTEPSAKVHPIAIKVMKEKDIDITSNKPKSVNDFLETDFDYVITVCGGAKETCPNFSGKVKKRLNIGFDDPAEAKGTEEQITSEFRKIRDEIVRDFENFHKTLLKN